MSALLVHSPAQFTSAPSPANSPGLPEDSWDGPQAVPALGVRESAGGVADGLGYWVDAHVMPSHGKVGTRTTSEGGWD